MTLGISVIMPVRNAGDFLLPAVESILAQQGVEFELIIIDDHSSDNALDALPDDRRIKHLSLDAESGIVAALNAGIAASRFEIIARMDGDDIAHPKRLKTQLEFMQTHIEVDIVGTQVELFSDDADIGEGYLEYQRWINAQCTPTEITRHFFVESCIPHPSAMLRKSVLIELGAYRDTAWPEDYDLWCRAHLAGKVFAKPVDKILLRWRDYPSRTSRTDGRYNKQHFLQCKAHYLVQYLQARGHSKCVVWGVGPTGLKLHDYLEQNGLAVNQFVDINPKMCGGTKRGKAVQVISTQPSLEELRANPAIMIVAVAARGARSKIYEALSKHGLTELEDFIFAA